MIHVLTLTLVLGGPGEPIRVRPATWAQPMLGTGLKNLYQVSPDLYRSEQPGSRGDLERLGIRSVLNLRRWHQDGDDLKGGPFELHAVPMRAGAMDDAKMREALAILRKAPKPVLVHCWHGSDRTGAVVALYRMVVQGWSREAAIDEFRAGGFGYHESVYPEIQTYLRTVDLRQFEKK